MAGCSPRFNQDGCTGTDDDDVAAALLREAPPVDWKTSTPSVVLDEPAFGSRCETQATTAATGSA